MEQQQHDLAVQVLHTSKIIVLTANFHHIVQRLTPRLPAYAVEMDQPRSRSSAALVLSPWPMTALKEPN